MENYFSAANYLRGESLISISSVNTEDAEEELLVLLVPAVDLGLGGYIRHISIVSNKIKVLLRQISKYVTIINLDTCSIL